MSNFSIEKLNNKPNALLHCTITGCNNFSAYEITTSTGNNTCYSLRLCEEHLKELKNFLNENV